MDLNLALNYGSRQEIVRAVREIISEGIPAESVTEQTIADHLYTAGQPDPDFVIRTSGSRGLARLYSRRDGEGSGGLCPPQAPLREDTGTDRRRCWRTGKWS